MGEVETLQLLVGSDLHNSRPGFEWFCRLAEQHQPDLIIFLGDFVNRSPVSFIREVLVSLRQLAPACFVIPGNWDPRETIIEIDIAATDGLRNLHRGRVELHGRIFAGLGGSTTTPLGDTPLEGPEDGFASPLAALLPADVWVLHNPVHGYRDAISSGARVGSRDLARLLEAQERWPRLVLSGHIHEAVGAEEQQGTLFVNPGSLAQRRAALVQLNGEMAAARLLEAGDV